MNNGKLSKLFLEIAHFLEMEEDAGFRSRAYKKVADSLENLNIDVSEIYEEGGVKALKEVPGIGEAIAGKIEEFLKNGEIKMLERLRKRKPLDMEELVRVEGLGPRKIKVLYKELDVANLEDLERVAKEGKIAELEGFGEKTQNNLLQGIEFLKTSKGRFLLGEAMPIAQEIEKRLKTLDEVSKVSVVGSTRRGRETIKDVDVLVGVAKKEYEKDAERIMSFFTSMPEVKKIWGSGETKSSVRLSSGINVDLRVVPLESYGAALQYFTGSQDHNIATRVIAKSKGMKLNEYGLFKGKKAVAGRSEAEIYEGLGMEYISPELRENEGEIEVALEKKLPKLVELEDIKGDLHCHTDWNGGKNSIEEMMEAAESMGYEYIGISDHTKFLKIENGLDEKKLLKQNKEIKKINERLRKKGREIVVLHGCEANIMKDGSLDIDNDVLSQLDYVMAGLHSHLTMGREEMTQRLVTAINNPVVNIISHPMTRLLKRRDEINVDFKTILEECLKNNVVLEINAHPVRLDLSDKRIRRANEKGVKMIINTDSHNINHMQLMRFGVIQARRGWAEEKDIVNMWDVEKLREFFKRNNI